jgi:hypothetical protein
MPDRLDSDASLLLSHRPKLHVVDGGRSVVRTTRGKLGSGRGTTGLWTVHDK